MPENSNNSLFRSNRAQIDRNLERNRKRVARYMETQPIVVETSVSNPIENIPVQEQTSMERFLQNLKSLLDNTNRTRTMGGLGGFLHFDHKAHIMNNGGNF